MTEYVSPEGTAIIGILVQTTGVQKLETINPDGTVDYADNMAVEERWEWDEVTKFDPITNETSLVFVDDEGECWTFDQLVPTPPIGD